MASTDLVAQVRSQEFEQQVALALPETVSARRFARIAVTAIQQNPDLGNCAPDSVFQSLLRCAQDGLLPDGREAALVKFGDKAQYMPMVGGYRKIAADHGWTLRARVVYQGDHFEFSEEPPTLAHRPAAPGADRGDLVAVYAIATHADGRRLQRVMYKVDVEQRKAVAKSKNVWQQWPAAMWEKTAARDLFGELPLGDLDRERIERLVAQERAVDEAFQDPAAALYGGRVSGELPASPDGGGNGGGTGAGVVAAPAAAEVVEDGDWTESEGPTPEQVAAADLAALVKPGGGPYRGRTFEEIAALDDGPAWFATQLRASRTPARVRQQLSDFCLVRLPEVWQAFVAQQELAA